MLNRQIAIPINVTMNSVVDRIGSMDGNGLSAISRAALSLSLFGSILENPLITPSNEFPRKS